MRKIEVKILSIEKGLTQYDEVTIIRIKSKKYNISIMKDYLPVIGEIEGDIELEQKEKTIAFKNIIGYYMLKHNQFKLFTKEEEKNG